LRWDSSLTVGAQARLGSPPFLPLNFVVEVDEALATSIYFKPLTCLFFVFIGLVVPVTEAIGNAASES
jgi:hypothetical protein